MLTESRVSVHELGCSRLPSSVGVCRPDPLSLASPRLVLASSASANAVLLAAAAADCMSSARNDQHKGGSAQHRNLTGTGARSAGV